MSKRTEAREKRRRRKQRQQFTFGLVALGVVLLLVAVAVLPHLQPTEEIVIPQPIEHPMENGVAMGDPNAPVTMVEYADYQCSYCWRYSEQTEPLLVKQYVIPGQLYIVFKNFALYDSSIPFAEAALCAADQNEFWEYHDILYANENTSAADKYSLSRLQAYAEAVGLDVDSFTQCLTDQRHLEDVQQIRAEAESAGVDSTPTFFVNGNRILGAQPLDVFQQEIEAALVGR
jgi:protein-disulfide isomerase